MINNTIESGDIGYWSDKAADLEYEISLLRTQLDALIGMGGPLNDNKLGYTKEQKVEIQRIADELGDVDDES